MPVQTLPLPELQRRATDAGCCLAPASAPPFSKRIYYLHYLKTVSVASDLVYPFSLGAHCLDDEESNDGVMFHRLCTVCLKLDEINANFRNLKWDLAVVCKDGKTNCGLTAEVPLSSPLPPAFQSTLAAFISSHSSIVQLDALLEIPIPQGYPSVFQRSVATVLADLWNPIHQQRA